MAVLGASSAPAVALSVQIQTDDFSQVIGESAVTVWTRTDGGVVNYFRIYNVSNVTIWCSRAGDAEVDGAGSFPIQAGTYELWVAPGPVPQNDLSIISTAADTPVTIEVG